MNTNKDDLYIGLMREDKMTDERKAASGRVEKGEEYDDVAGLKYEPNVDSEPQQSSEGEMQTCSMQSWIRAIRRKSDLLTLAQVCIRL